MSAFIFRFIECFSDWILVGEVSLHESLVDDRNAWIRVTEPEVSASEKRNPHGAHPAWRDIQEVGQIVAGRAAVYRDRIILGVAAEQRPTRQCYGFNSRHSAQMLGNLIPACVGLSTFGHRVESEKPIRGEAGGLMRKPVEGSDEEPGHEKHEKTEGHLQGDQRMHDTTPRMWVFATFQSADGLDGRGAPRGNQAEQECHADGQREAESKYPPVRGEGQSHRVVRRIDDSDHEGGGPPREDSAQRGGE